MAAANEYDEDGSSQLQGRTVAVVVALRNVLIVLVVGVVKDHPARSTN